MRQGNDPDPNISGSTSLRDVSARLSPAICINQTRSTSLNFGPRHLAGLNSGPGTTVDYLIDKLDFKY